jgi:hypothetical protein
VGKFNLTKDHTKKVRDEFATIRGTCIQAYAGLEQSLCFLLSVFAQTRLDVASVIFFKNMSTDATRKMLDKLLKMKYLDKYTSFWNSLFDLLGQTNQRRNEIVHWNASIRLMPDGLCDIQLLPPAFSFFLTHPPDAMKIALSKDDLLFFIGQCNFLSELCQRFYLFLHPNVSSKWPEEQQKTWRDIFAQPVVFPPHSSHPLYQMTKGRESQPPPSPESLPPSTDPKSDPQEPPI